MITDARGNLLMSATVHSTVFTKNIPVADFQKRWLADVFQVLCFSTDGSKGEKFIVMPDLAWPINHHMRMKHTSIAQHHIVTNHTIGADDDIGTDMGAGGNDGGRMKQNSRKNKR